MTRRYIKSGHLTQAGAILGLLLYALPVHADEAPRADVASAVVEHGGASYYSDKFQGKPTASGELHDQNALTAASRDLPLGSTARVTNLENGKSVEVEITDRGPYARGLVIDLSKRAASTIGINTDRGVAPVRVEASANSQPTAELKQQIVAIGEKRRAARSRRSSGKTSVARAASLP
ncbi:MAG: septal ring lytic transglycosylase RlpA family protein [Rhodospirillaceae bacterium]